MQVFLLIVLLLVLVVVLIFAARQCIGLYREAHEQGARDREERRESIALSRRMWRTIRQGEEMDIDVTNLRQARNALDFTRKADVFLNRKRTNAILPLAFVVILLLVYELVPFQMIVGWFGWSLLGVVLLLCLWSGILFFRYSRLKRAIVRLITEQEASLPPSPFQQGYQHLVSAVSQGVSGERSSGARRNPPARKRAVTTTYRRSINWKTMKL